MKVLADDADLSIHTFIDLLPPHPIINSNFFSGWGPNTNKVKEIFAEGGPPSATSG